MKKTSRIIATVMAVLMIFTAIPMTAFAESTPVALLNTTYTITVPANEVVEYIFTPSESGIYVAYSYSGERHYEIDPKINILDSNNMLVNASDDSAYGMGYNFCCIFEAEAGEEYSLMIDAFDDKDITFEFTVCEYTEIDHQPTADEPYVTLTNDVDAEYAWYAVSNDIVTVDDKRAVGREGDEGYSTYSSDKGWKGVYTGYDDDEWDKEYNFFTIYLLAGQTLEFTIDTDSPYFEIWSYTAEGDYWYDVEADSTCTFTAIESGYYNLFGYYTQVPYLTAVASEMTLIEGENDAEVDTSYNGEYICKVSYEDTRFEFSDTFEITDGIDRNCDHMCHKDGFLGFIWTIINFFSSIFGLNPFCDCGVSHY